MTTTEKIGVATIVVTAIVAAVGWLFAWNARRRKIRFSVGRRMLVPPPGGPPQAEIIAIDVLNPGNQAVEIVAIGLRLIDGSGLFPIQFRGLPNLPAWLQPTSSFVMAVDPVELLRALNRRPAAAIDKVYGRDGSGRPYQRKLTGVERKEIREALSEVR